MIFKTKICRSDMSKRNYSRVAMNYVGIMHRIPEIMGLELVWRKDAWEGRYYITGERHSWKKDKLKVKLWTRAEGTDIMVHEQGGESMCLQTWLIRFGGARDWKSAMDIMRGNSTPIREYMHHNIRNMVESEVRYVPREVFEQYRGYELERSSLFMWLCRLFGEFKVREAFERYNVTSDGQGNTIYWYMDAEGRIVHDKVMRYKANGKRDKTFTSRRFKVGDGYTSRVFFGAHLVEEGKDVHCVESEKSAIIMSIVQPEKIWIATGGLSNLYECTEEMWLYPDVDAIERWSVVPGAKIVEWWQGIKELGDHDDIADIAIREKQSNYYMGRYRD